jgi:hypothetical protein
MDMLCHVVSIGGFMLGERRSGLILVGVVALASSALSSETPW